MKHNEIEAKLKNAVSNAAPDVLENILHACDQKKGTVIEMKQKANTNKGKNKALRVCAAIAAAAAMLVMGVLIGRGSGHTPLYASDVAAIISLDVNPSVELRVDATEKVLAAEAHNADGEAVLAGMELAGTELNVAVNAIVGSMLKLGYIDELANSILISVEGMDGTDAKALESKLVAEVEAVFAQSPVGSGAILSQNVSDADDALSAKAGEYGITVGKAALIEEILQGNARYTFEELAGLSINELNLLAKNVSLTHVNSVGQASDKAYIGTDAAVEAALKHAGVARADATGLEVELDCENGRMVYEVEFDAANAEYEYDVDAETGEIVWYEAPGIVRGETGESGAPKPTAGNEIGKEAAKQAAFRHANVKEADVTALKVEVDREDGVLHYDVDFHCGGYEYGYEIDAQTGAVLKQEREQDDDAGGKPAGTPDTSGGSLIGISRAKEIALAHAGLSGEKVTELKAELDREDGRQQYEVEFKAGGYEYDYEIDAQTGKILEWDKDFDD
ncbi:MAG: PepSY domain-containing protein [Christensenella sp.]|jgi:uncharacterized membrane protein YkoI|nr:PepSY domain-containing protein [Christensenella sp.]